MHVIYLNNKKIAHALGRKRIRNKRIKYNTLVKEAIKLNLGETIKEQEKKILLTTILKLLLPYVPLSKLNNFEEYASDQFVGRDFFKNIKSIFGIKTIII